MGVVNLKAYRARVQSKTPCTITLIGHPFYDAEGKPVQPMASFQILDGDYQQAIDGFRDDGGFYATSKDDDMLFCPWPPASIRIRRVMTATESPPSGSPR